MSTTTTAPTFTGNAAQLPNGVTVDTIVGLMEQGATEKTAYAVAWRATGGSNADGGASMEAVFGAPVKAGGFGNLVTTGLRKVGREGEVSSAPSTGGGIKVPSFADYIANYRNPLDAKHAALAKAFRDATAAVGSVDPDALVAAEGERLDKVIAEAKATKNALTKDPSAFVDAATERLRHAADAAGTAYATGHALINHELGEAKLPLIDAPDVPELATQGEATPAEATPAEGEAAKA